MYIWLNPPNSVLIIYKNKVNIFYFHLKFINKRKWITYIILLEWCSRISITLEEHCEKSWFFQPLLISNKGLSYSGFPMNELGLKGLHEDFKSLTSITKLWLGLNLSIMLDMLFHWFEINYRALTWLESLYDHGLAWPLL